MKLIRLATNDNGNFSSSFGNEMILKPNAKMALLNLTFNSSIGKLTTSNDQSITTKTDAVEPLTQKIHTLDNREFASTEAGFKEYKEYIISSLNSSIAMTRGKNNESNAVGSQYTIQFDEDGTEEIVYRYAPCVNGLATKDVYKNYTTGGTAAIDVPDFMEVNPNLLVEGLEEGILVDTNQRDINWIQTTMQPNVNQNNTNNRDNCTGCTTEICPGSGFMSCRIADLVDRADAGNSNGFGIGLSKIPLSFDDNRGGFNGAITTEMIFADIFFNQSSTPYKFTTQNFPGQEFSASFNPFKTNIVTDTDIDTHDIMGFEIQGNTCTICVYQAQAAPNNRRVVAIVNIPPGQKLYPYFYMRGAGTAKTGSATPDCTADMLNFTYNSLQYAKDGGNLAEDPISRIGWGPSEENEWYRLMDRNGGADVVGCANGYGKMMQSVTNLSIDIGIPSIQGGQKIVSTTFQPRWILDFIQSTVLSKDILVPIGFGIGGEGFQTFTNNGLGDPFWTSEFSADRLPRFYTADNFLVESVTLPLDSFDASEVQYNSLQNYPPETEKTGRRKNILMTIPISDNDTGLVEFETNTPVFIDINNAESINVKNLNFRVLRKDFSPIDQSSEDAIMTVLIDDSQK